MKKRYALLRLFPCGDFRSGNTVIAETNQYMTKEQAIDLFQSAFANLTLNSNGYAKIGEISYCIAEFLY